ncbi:MAG: 30S ribosomal protein S4 [Methanothrix sp.]|jgi:small subunit ribosomal protein S4|nr:30S ribosomal protein S4 [Methanothrix sp.]OPX81094.1 MAG: 30S ribosomal protein S4 [Methanosaeta sp. PtaB.Bin087]OPY51883.1 MAG: 30S ribosomal protein S4 [Methanosaeta sp. PtaU1.Bin055]NLX39679.1 30S ribosomal protein S4 [Methanothrix sp.]HNR58862.1 30S ribosomal protein S4 [Methanothrix sp.]
MGYPGKCRKSYDTPRHPWEADRMAQELELVKSYGLRNKREVWKAQSLIRKYRRVSRQLLAATTRGDASVGSQAEDVLEHLKNYGMMKEDGDLDSVLSITVEDLLERRLQTQVYRQGLAKTLRQSRQFITHGHIQITGRKVTVPGYYVKRGEEMTIDYYPGSPMAQEAHPERATRILKVEG